MIFKSDFRLKLEGSNVTFKSLSVHNLLLYFCNNPRLDHINNYLSYLNISSTIFHYNVEAHYSLNYFSAFFKDSYLVFNPFNKFGRTVFDFINKKISSPIKLFFDFCWQTSFIKEFSKLFRFNIGPNDLNKVDFNYKEQSLLGTSSPYEYSLLKIKSSTCNSRKVFLSLVKGNYLTSLYKYKKLNLYNYRYFKSASTSMGWVDKDLNWLDINRGTDEIFNRVLDFFLKNSSKTLINGKGSMFSEVFKYKHILNFKSNIFGNSSRGVYKLKGDLISKIKSYKASILSFTYRGLREFIKNTFLIDLYKIKIKLQVHRRYYQMILKIKNDKLSRYIQDYTNPRKTVSGFNVCAGLEYLLPSFTYIDLYNFIRNGFVYLNRVKLLTLFLDLFRGDILEVAICRSLFLIRFKYLSSRLKIIRLLRRRGVAKLKVMFNLLPDSRWKSYKLNQFYKIDRIYTFFKPTVDFYKHIEVDFKTMTFYIIRLDSRFNFLKRRWLGVYSGSRFKVKFLNWKYLT